MSRVRIKICGITRTEDAEAAVRLGVDALGLNFYSGSPRAVDIHQAAEVLKVVPPLVTPVALFVDPSVAVLEGTLAALPGLGAVQWHGGALAGRDRVRSRMIQAWSVADDASLTALTELVTRLAGLGHRPDALLLDAQAPGLHGGTGRVAPWDLLAGFSPGLPVILAGGLTADNVVQAIRRVRPYAVDLASGVEVRPGVKDHEAMRRFVDAVRSA